ncbi:MAG: hypothetical protein ACO2PP_19390 [Thermocrinis sp.]|jgi:hypothetical protein|uniref:hypothetical protein n=1 Tax=Thermocrinis sp. TaxID=2024383 RepID=UPI003C0BD305
MFNFRDFHRIQKIAWGLFYEPPAYAIGFETLSVKEFPTGENVMLVPVGRLYVRDIRVIDTLDVPFPPQREGFIIPAETPDGLPVVQVVAGGEVVALAGQGFLIFDPIIPAKRESLLVLSKALSRLNPSTAAMLC